MFRLFHCFNQCASNCNNDIQLKHSNNRPSLNGQAGAPPRRRPISESRSMFPFLRISAVMTSIVVASTALGFGIGTALKSSEPVVISEIGSGFWQASRVVDNEETMNVRPGARLRSMSMTDIAFDTVNAPAVNAVGPLPGGEHVNLGRATNRMASPLMAMN
jgi:hypothetical protein